MRLSCAPPEGRVATHLPRWRDAHRGRGPSCFREAVGAEVGLKPGGGRWAEGASGVARRREQPQRHSGEELLPAGAAVTREQFAGTRCVRGELLGAWLGLGVAAALRGPDLTGPGDTSGWGVAPSPSAVSGGSRRGASASLSFRYPSFSRLHSAPKLQPPEGRLREGERIPLGLLLLTVVGFAQGHRGAEDWPISPGEGWKVRENPAGREPPSGPRGEGAALGCRFRDPGGACVPLALSLLIRQVCQALSPPPSPWGSLLCATFCFCFLRSPSPLLPRKGWHTTGANHWGLRTSGLHRELRLEEKETDTAGTRAAFWSQGPHASAMVNRTRGWSGLPALPAETSLPLLLAWLLVLAEGGTLWNLAGDVQTERGACHCPG